MWAAGTAAARSVAAQAFEQTRRFCNNCEDYARRNPRKVKRAISIAFSLIIHALFVLAILRTASDAFDVVGSEEGMGNVINVSLARPGGAAHSEESEDALTPEEALVVLATIDPTLELDPADLDGFANPVKEASGDGTSEDDADFTNASYGDAYA